MASSCAHPIGILNCAIVTGGPGTYVMEDITIDAARNLLANTPFESFIGHESTAALLTQLLHADITTSRASFRQQLHQRALVFQLADRLPEGKVLSADELAGLNFTLMLCTKTL